MWRTQDDTLQSYRPWGVLLACQFSSWALNIHRRYRAPKLTKIGNCRSCSPKKRMSVFFVNFYIRWRLRIVCELPIHERIILGNELLTTWRPLEDSLVWNLEDRQFLRCVSIAQNKIWSASSLTLVATIKTQFMLGNTHTHGKITWNNVKMAKNRTFRLCKAISPVYVCSQERNLVSVVFDTGSNYYNTIHAGIYTYTWRNDLKQCQNGIKSNFSTAYVGTPEQIFFSFVYDTGRNNYNTITTQFTLGSTHITKWPNVKMS